MNSNSAWEQFQGATLSLVRSGALKDRITNAYRNHLAHVDEAELPKDVREAFRSFHRTMTREPPLVRGDDAFRATLRKMSVDEAEEVACSVVRMLCALQRSGTVSTRAGAQVVPFYIAEHGADESGARKTPPAGQPAGSASADETAEAAPALNRAAR